MRDQEVYATAACARKAVIVSEHPGGLREAEMVKSNDDVNPRFDPAAVAIHEARSSGRKERPDVQIRRERRGSGIPKPKAHLSFHSEPPAKIPDDTSI
jgi:hypothetical protein